jgi:hypothetical protein
MIGSLLPFPAVIMSLLGFEFWRRWWMRRGNCGLVPAVPGLFLGLAGYSLLQIPDQGFFDDETSKGDKSSSSACDNKVLVICKV